MFIFPLLNFIAAFEVNHYDIDQFTVGIKILKVIYDVTKLNLSFSYFI